MTIKDIELEAFLLPFEKFRCQPEGIQIYEVSGQKIFPSCSITGYDAKIFVILMKIIGENYFKYVISLPLYLTAKEQKDEIEDSLQAFIEQLRNGTAKTVNPDGGEFGLGDNLERLQRVKE